MKFVAQRVLRATLTVNGQLVSEIGRGLVVFLGVKTDDGVVKAEKIAEKIGIPWPPSPPEKIIKSSRGEEPPLHHKI